MSNRKRLSTHNRRGIWKRKRLRAPEGMTGRIKEVYGKNMSRCVKRQLNKLTGTNTVKSTII